MVFLLQKWVAPNPSVLVCIMRDACECMGLNTPGDVGLVTQQQHRLATLLLGLCYYRLLSVLQSHTLSPLMLLAPVQRLQPTEEGEEGPSREYPLRFVGERGLCS